MRVWGPRCVWGPRRLSNTRGVCRPLPSWQGMGVRPRRAGGGPRRGGGWAGGSLVGFCLVQVSVRPKLLLCFGCFSTEANRGRPLVPHPPWDTYSASCLFSGNSNSSYTEHHEKWRTHSRRHQACLEPWEVCRLRMVRRTRSRFRETLRICYKRGRSESFSLIVPTPPLGWRSPEAKSVGTP